MTVSIAAPQANDKLSATASGGVTVAGNGGSSLTLSGSASAASYQTVLRSLTYQDTVANSIYPVTVNVVGVDQAGASSATATDTINVVAPFGIMLNPPQQDTYVPYVLGQDGAVNLAGNATVASSNNDNISSITVNLNGSSGGFLNAASSGSVNVSGAGTTTLTLTGSATADYQAVLRTITYENDSLFGDVYGFVDFTVTDAVTHATFGAFAGINELSNTVTNRFLFYKDSSRYDQPGGTNGRPASIPFSDDNAIASDKTALLPGGGAATMYNVSSFDQGINGIMLDLLGNGLHGAINASDFTIRVGNNNSPSTWAAGPALTVSVRLGMTGAADGAGTVSGSDRVELTWADGAITEEWVEVIVKANTHTGLAANGVFYFGSEIGATGSSTTLLIAMVTSADVTDAQTHGASIKANIPTSNLYDFNKDGQVASVDVSDAQTHGTSVKTGLDLISIASGGPFAPDDGDDGADGDDDTGDDEDDDDDPSP